MHSHELLPILKLLEPGALSGIELPDLKAGSTDEEPRTFLLRGRELLRLREALKAKEGVLANGYDTLIQLADEACNVEPMSVCDKVTTPTGAGSNDYCSLARYAWPDPDSGDGLPYRLRDGESNPEAYDETRFDVQRLERLASNLFVLSVAYYLSGEAKYGEKAADFLRRWFVTEATRQSPHFRFSQMIPGKEGTRGIGIIEARRYLYVIDAEALISGCSAWTPQDAASFRGWFRSFFIWLRTSSQGVHAASRSNNIALWYDLQCAIYALFLDERELAEVIVRESHARRLKDQVGTDGSQPEELKRERPYDYVLFNLLAMMGMARAGELAGFDGLWTDSRDGKSFERAMEWLLGIVRSRQGVEIGEVEDAVSLVGLRCAREDAEATVVEKERTIERLQRELDEGRVEAEELRRSIGTMELELATNQEAAGTLREQVERLDRERSETKDKWSEEKTRSDQLQQALEEENARREALSLSLAAMQRSIEVERGETDARLESLQGDFRKERDALRQALEAEREDAERRFEGMQRHQSELSASLRDGEVLIDVLQDKLVALKEELRKEVDLRNSGAMEVRNQKNYSKVLSEELRRSNEELVRLGKALARSHKDLKEVYRSSSWRAMAPMRRAVSWMRGQSGPVEKKLAKETKPVIRKVPTYRDVVREGALTEVRMVRSKLLNLGFHERGLDDLRAMVIQKPDPDLRQFAAWELAVWHANRYDQGDARECLRFLDIASEGALDRDQARRMAVLRAESHRLLGELQRAAETLDAAIDEAPHADLYLGMANLEQEVAGRLQWINLALRHHGLQELGVDGKGASPYDRLRAAGPSGGLQQTADAPLVSIIVPAYNASGMIATTIESLLAQSWKNIEILVSDDCSTDDMSRVVEEFANRDPRVHLLRGLRNAGPYVARNHALRQAKGEFITCNDSDDWSHPRKIEIQAMHLLENQRIMANTSPQARMYEDMTFYRRGNPGFYVQPNMSSLMFRRAVVDRIGYWDSVRFAADSEYTRRIRTVFGKGSIIDLDVGPLSFQRQTGGSLTGSETFGYHGFKMGARREYEQAHSAHHKSGRNLFVDFPLEKRPFVVPEPMRPDREVVSEQRRKFDVVLVSDFRMPGGTSMSNIEEIKAQRRMGLRTGLVQMSRYDGYPGRPLNPKVRELVDGEAVDLLVYGEKISCDLLILRLPWILEEWQEYIPDIDAKEIRVIVNQPPKRDYAPGSELLYHLDRCAEHMKRYFGRIGTWHPIGPLVRQVLLDQHRDELGSIDLSDEDWLNIIDVNEWMRPARPAPAERIRICRHSRDQYVKWPSTREDLLTIYPDSDRYEIRVLGGASVPRKLLGGQLPGNWTVKNFGERSPRKFLSECDVFVYYTYPDWVESFGRVIFEAMAVGLPVILPAVYEPLFKEAAIYAEPSEVLARVDELMADEALYAKQVDKARGFVESHFGYSLHAARLGRATGARLPLALEPA